MKEDGKVNAPTLPVPGSGGLGGRSLGEGWWLRGRRRLCPAPTRSWRSSCSAQWETQRWWHRQGAVRSPQGSAPQLRGASAGWDCRGAAAPSWGGVLA